jgi:ferredoxin
MQVDVNVDRCEGHGLCEQAAPEVYGLDDEGIVQLLVDPVPSELGVKAAAGARVCPVSALRVVSADA